MIHKHTMRLQNVLHIEFTSSFTICRNIFLSVLLLFVCLQLNACRLAQVLSTQYSENIATANYGTEANHPGLNDGNLETIATLPAKNDRNFIIRFAEIHPVRKIIIHNGNLFRFQMEYLNSETDKWEAFHSVIQRRNLEGKRAQPTFVIDRLDIETKMIRIAVSRTVDDIIVNKVVVDKGDKVVNRRMTIGNQYYPHYRVVRPSIAQVREIEIYHLAKNN
ncbi:hypothetical protein C6497_15785 [Candidatus Poribacteria bacterium]|nr:MAG: hypothetical protein C6497_15785 [Candidatus Poribacteria bacterium]